MVPFLRSVVHIAILSCLLPAPAGAVTGRESEEAWQDYATRLSTAYVRIAGGSGVVISRDGLMLTNHHVIQQDYEQKKLRFKVRVDNKDYEAVVLGTDVRGDIALLRIEQATNLAYLTFADSDALRIGQQVVAIGNPFGAMGPTGDPTVTFGVISCLHRFSGAYSDAIQTDAPVNPGNSGGPLIDLAGQLVGINGRIQSKTGSRSNTGIGLAIPTNQIQRFLPELKAVQGGVVLHAHLPGLVGDVTEADGMQNGAELKAVQAGSLAATCGLKAGDRVTSVDGMPVLNFIRLRGLIGTYPARAKITLTVERDGKEQALPVTLGTFDLGDWGFEWNLPRKPKDQAALEQHLRADPRADIPVLVTKLKPGHPAGRCGLKRGDQIVAIDGQPVPNLLFFNNLSQALINGDRFWAGSTISLKIRRDGAEQDLQLELGSQYTNYGK